MLNRHLHDWNLSPREAIALQRRLAGRVEREDRLGEVSARPWMRSMIPASMRWP